MSSYPPGWYPNPQGSGQRYWDGSRWTDDYSPPPPPQQQQQQQFQPQQPQFQRPPQYQQLQKKGGGTVWKVMLGVVLGGLVLIGGCAALIAGGVEEAEDELTKNAITRAEFRSVAQGTSQSQVERRFGEPQDSQEFEQELPELQDSPERSSCIYYAEKGKDFLEGDTYQFCFDDGKLTSKNAY